MTPIVSLRRREPSHRPELPQLRLLGGAEEPCEPLVEDPDRSAPPGPTLRVLAGEESAPTRAQAASVLLAGADPRRRALLRAELGATLSQCTPFAEANDVAGVLERAPSSRMVILAGDLEDADADASMRLLGRRHPRLPVVCVGAPSISTAAGGHG